MKLRKIKTNQTEITINDKTVFFSYNTPVAGYDDNGAFRTDKRFSVTTSKHITQYFNGDKNIARVVPQSYIESLVQ
ncbi:MAG: hypothetical protein ACR2L5_03765 [Candidatus Actinomarinaceae bacterium]